MPNGRFISTCFYCKAEMWLPQELYDAAQRSSKITFYCAYGHEQVFSRGDSELDIVRRERDRLKQRIAQRDEEIAVQAKLVTNLKTQRAFFKAESTKLKTRAKAGVCPCCNRTVSQFARHMQSKHPNYIQAHEVH